MICSIIGPNSLLLGSYDIESDIRKQFRTSIKSILIEFDCQSAVTGLGVGVEQDFAIACLELEIPYTVYLPYPRQEDAWKKLEKVQSLYRLLCDYADSLIILNDGQYSPRKIIQKNAELIRESNVIIYVSHPLAPTDKLPSYFNGAKDKTIIQLKCDHIPISL